MRAIPRAARILALGSIVAAWTLTATPAGAEVGVMIGEQLQVTGGPYQILSLIVDDPDPFNSWTVHSPPNSDRAVLNPDGETNGDGVPSAVMNSFSGLPTVAWARNDAGGFDIVVSHYANGAWSAPEVVAGGSDDELDPRLVIDPANGTVHLFFWVDAPIPVVMHREAPADLSSWSAPIQVSNGIDPAFRPSGVVHDGVLKVAYEVHPFGSGQTPRNVVLATRDGQSFASQVVAVTSYDGDLWPQAHCHAGRLWLDWVDGDDSMAWAYLEGEEVWGPIDQEGFGSLEEREFNVRVSIRVQVTQLP